MTAQSDETAVWHESRKPSRTWSWPSWTVSMIVGGGTLPLTILMRQLWQRPRPPHVAITSMPASCAARRNVCPGPTMIVCPAGAKVDGEILSCPYCHVRYSVRTGLNPLTTACHVNQSTAEYHYRNFPEGKAERYDVRTDGEAVVVATSPRPFRKVVG